jgi:hypothetical protein
MEIADIYIHDGILLRVTEEPEHARITMHVALPKLELDEALVPRLLVFEDVYSYQVVEGGFNGCPTLLGFNIVGKEAGGSRVRLETTVGFREIVCGSVSELKYEAAAQSAHGSKPRDDATIATSNQSWGLVDSRAIGPITRL